LKVCLHKLLAKAEAQGSNRSSSSSYYGLQFDVMAGELLQVAAAVSQPWVLLYCSYTRAQAPYWVPRNKVQMLMVDRVTEAGVHCFKEVLLPGSCQLVPPADPLVPVPSTVGAGEAAGHQHEQQEEEGKDDEIGKRNRSSHSRAA
jgi:hypothetical protein